MLRRILVEAKMFSCPARFDWSSVEVSLGGPFAGYRDDPRTGGEPPGLGRRGSIAESAVRSDGGNSTRQYERAPMPL
jgi:hypothetical protein